MQEWSYIWAQNCFETRSENIAEYFNNFQSDATDSQTMTIPNRRFAL